MKINLPQLTPTLAKSMAHVYLICGDEPWQKEYALDQIRQAAKKRSIAERERLTVDGNFDPAMLYNALYASSLFADQRLIELDLRDSFPNKALAQMLCDYMAHPSDSIVLLLISGKVDSKAAKSAWYTTLEKSGIVITIWPISKEQLPQWIMQHGKTHALHITKEAATLLADSTEGNLLAAAQMIEKIELLQPKQAIDSDFLLPLLSSDSQFTLFDLTDSLLLNDQARRLAILEQLKQHDTEPVLILWALTRELRILSDCADSHAKHQPLDSVFKKHRIFPRKQPAIKAYLARHTAEDCYMSLKRALAVDDAIKGGDSDQVWPLLTYLCLAV